jgi:hypothetical protein
MFTLFSRPYLDTCSKNYYNIVTVNIPPPGPLAKFVQGVKFYPLSQFKSFDSSSQTRSELCGLAIVAPFAAQGQGNGCKIPFVTTDNVPLLFSYLVENGYTIDTSLTKMTIMTGLKFQTQNANTLIAFVKYNSN